MNSKVKAYAKINLWLDITGRRADGYHTLNTVMRRIGLYDDIEVSADDTGNITLECDEPAVPCDERNIAFKAVRAFSERIGKPVGAHIRITKRIPLEAGLGGSSTDGAAVLCVLNELYGKPLTMAELCSLGASLGADVPFCIVGGTSVCTGIGDIMRSADCADIAAVLIKPDFSCSTAEAYHRYDEAPVAEKPGFREYIKSLGQGAEAVAGGLYNVFEMLYADERIEHIKRDLLESGALGAAMTGSGSAVYGVFRNIEEARKAAEKLGYERKFAVNAI